jgi:hypothetical protein
MSDSLIGSLAMHCQSTLIMEGHFSHLSIRLPDLCSANFIVSISGSSSPIGPLFTQLSHLPILEQTFRLETARTQAVCTEFNVWP